MPSYAGATAVLLTLSTSAGSDRWRAAARTSDLTPSRQVEGLRRAGDTYLCGPMRAEKRLPILLPKAGCTSGLDRQGAVVGGLLDADGGTARWLSVGDEFR